ncbi:hypothetical protein [Variovorax sp. LjRoot178]|uniref:hypothetical protein n=2 Tax=Variovorax TaxID=34072 RepID=UPI003F50DA6C
MYYMKRQNLSQPRWSPEGLLSLLRASLPPAGPGATPLPAPPARLDSRQLTEVASQWRRRSESGDEGAESVAAALDYIATRRARERGERIQAMGKRLSQLMQLS